MPAGGSTLGARPHSCCRSSRSAGGYRDRPSDVPFLVGGSFLGVAVVGNTATLDDSSRQRALEAGPSRPPDGWRNTQNGTMNGPSPCSSSHDGRGAHPIVRGSRSRRREWQDFFGSRPSAFLEVPLGFGAWTLRACRRLRTVHDPEVRHRVRPIHRSVLGVPPTIGWPARASSRARCRELSSSVAVFPTTATPRNDPPTRKGTSEGRSR